ncbi:alpha/beta hydrolase [Streptomyces sp. NPDC049555]|uniref:alpha/beta hydrolase family protein n=1 Tax=Streptomyces sp. NPDC049555 TaxID=3154930 RepID=UPI003427FE32
MKRRTLVAGLAALAVAPRAASAVTPLLPPPTGPYPVGVTELYLVDSSRNDPWEPRIGVREVMVSVFHPARTVRGHHRAPQMHRGAAKAFGAFDVVHFHSGLPRAGVDWAATRTHAYAGAPAHRGRRWPVLLYSPGGGDPRTMGTSLAEELASHGYAVVTVDHPGDAGEVEFPCGRAGRERVRGSVFTGDPRHDPAVFRTAIAARVADCRFVLDRLARGVCDVPLDLDRVGVYGHSAGGTAAAQALYEDRRIRAAIDLEGYLDHPTGELLPVARYGVDRPLLLLGTDGFRSAELDRSWGVMRGARRQEIRRAAHWVFTDYAAVVPQLQAAGLMSARDRAAMVGTGDPVTAVRTVRERVLAFFLSAL